MQSQTADTSSSTACVECSSCQRDDQFERGVRSCVDVAVGRSVEILELRGNEVV